MVTGLALDGGFYRVSLAALPDAPWRARRFLRDRLTLWNLPIDDDTAECALLLLTELVTNAVRRTGRVSGSPHALPDETIPTIEIRAAASWSSLLIEVWDNDPQPPVVTNAADDAESGRGVFIVATVAHEWGYRPETRRPATRPGKTVWFSLKRDFTTRAPTPATVRPAVPAQRPVTRAPAQT